MKILIVCDRFPPPWNGGDTMVAMTFKRLLSRIAETSVLTCCFSTPSMKDGVFRLLTPKGVWSRDQNSLYSAYLDDRKVVEKVLGLTQPDVIFFLHLWGIAGETIRYLDRYGLRKIYRFGDECFRLHCISPRDSLRQGWISSPMETISGDCIIVNSQELSKRIRDYTTSPVIVARNSVIITEYTPPSPTALRLCYVGRIVPHKGVETCLKVALELQSNSIDFNMQIVGPGCETDYGAELREKYSGLEASGLVEWTGSIPHTNVRGAIEKARYLLFPSRRRGPDRTIEGCPNVILEAWASKRMVIANSDAGHREFLSHLDNCWIIDSDSSHLWKDTLLYCQEREDLYHSITSAALKNVREHHSVQQFERIMFEVLANIHP